MSGEQGQSKEQQSPLSRVIAERYFKELENGSHRYFELSGEEFTPTPLPLLEGRVVVLSRLIGQVLGGEESVSQAAPEFARFLTIEAASDELSPQDFANEEEFIRDSSVLFISTAEKSLSLIVEMARISTEVASDKCVSSEDVFRRDELYDELVRRTTTPIEFFFIDSEFLESIDFEEFNRLVLSSLGNKGYDMTELIEISNLPEYKNPAQAAFEAWKSKRYLIVRESLERFWGAGVIGLLPSDAQSKLSSQL